MCGVGYTGSSSRCIRWQTLLPSCEVLSRLTRYRNFKWMGLHEHACDQTAEISSNHTPDEGQREDGDEGKNGGLLL